MQTILYHLRRWVAHVVAAALALPVLYIWWPWLITRWAKGNAAAEKWVAAWLADCLLDQDQKRYFHGLVWAQDKLEQVAQGALLVVPVVKRQHTEAFVYMVLQWKVMSAQVAAVILLGWAIQRWRKRRKLCEQVPTTTPEPEPAQWRQSHLPPAPQLNMFKRSQDPPRRE